MPGSVGLFADVGALDQVPCFVEVLRLRLYDEASSVREGYLLVVLHPREVDAWVVPQAQECEAITTVVVEDDDTMDMLGDHV